MGSKSESSDTSPQKPFAEPFSWGGLGARALGRLGGSAARGTAPALASDRLRPRGPGRGHGSRWALRPLRAVSAAGRRCPR